MKPGTICGLILSFFFLSISVAGQVSGGVTPSSRAGSYSIAGIVFAPDGRPMGRGVSVKLTAFANDLSTLTDADGKFIFTGIGNGTYTLSASAGDEFEPVSQRFEITQPRSGVPQTFPVDLQLRWRPGMKMKPGVIDAEMARVPKKSLQYYNNATAATAKGDHQNAAEELRRAIAEYPEFATAHAELGKSYLKLNQLESADEHLRLALKLKPGTFDALANLGIVLVRLKKQEEAESVLREALKVKNDSAMTHFYLGRSLAGQNKADAAETAFRTALTMGGNDMVEARRALANIYLQRGDNEKALAEIEAYLLVNPKPADEKKLRETVQQIKNELKKNPNP